MNEKRPFSSKKRVVVATLACVFIFSLLASTVSSLGLWRPVSVFKQVLSRPAQSSAVIHIDKQGYVAGETIQISGSGFAPFERVMLRVAHANGSTETGMGHEPWFISAGADGSFSTTWTLSRTDT